MSDAPLMDENGTLHVVRLQVLGLTGISVETLAVSRKEPPPSPRQMKAVLAVMKNSKLHGQTCHSRRLVRAANPVTVNNRKQQRYIAVWDAKKQNENDWVEFEARLETGQTNPHGSRRSMLHRNIDLIVGLSTGLDHKATPIGAASLPLAEAAKLRGSNGKVVLDLPVFNYASLTNDPFVEPNTTDTEMGGKPSGLRRIRSIRRTKQSVNVESTKVAFDYDQTQKKDVLGHDYYMDPTASASVMRVELEIQQKEPNIETETTKAFSKTGKEQHVVLVHSQAEAIETARTVLRSNSSDAVGNLLMMEPSFEHILTNSDDATVLSLEQTDASPSDMDTKQFRVNIVDQTTMDCELSPVSVPVRARATSLEDENVRIMDAAIERVLSMNENEEDGMENDDDESLLEPREPPIANSSSLREEKKGGLFGRRNRRKKRDKAVASKTKTAMIPDKEKEPLVTVEIERIEPTEETKKPAVENATESSEDDSVCRAIKDSSGDTDVPPVNPNTSRHCSVEAEYSSSLFENGLDTETKKRIKSLARDQAGSKGIASVFSEKKDLLHSLEKHPLVAKLYNMILDDDDDDSIGSWTNYDTAAYHRDTLSDDLADLGLLLGEACRPMALDDRAYSFLDDEMSIFDESVRLDSTLSSLAIQKKIAQKPRKKPNMPPLQEVDEISQKSADSALSEEELVFRKPKSDAVVIHEGKEVNETDLKTVLAGALLAAEENLALAKKERGANEVATPKKEKKEDSTRKNFLQRVRSGGSFSKSPRNLTKMPGSAETTLQKGPGKQKKDSSGGGFDPSHVEVRLVSPSTPTRKSNLPPRARSAPLAQKPAKFTSKRKTPSREVEKKHKTRSKESPDHVMDHPNSEPLPIDPLAYAKTLVAVVGKAITPTPDTKPVPGMPKVPSVIDSREIVSVGDLTATSHELKVDIAEFKKKIRERALANSSDDDAAADTAKAKRAVAVLAKRERNKPRKGKK